MTKLTLIFLSSAMLLTGILGGLYIQQQYIDLLIQEVFTPIIINQSDNIIIIDNYTIYFEKECITESPCGGWTMRRGDIHILNNQSLYRIYKVCVHEKCHLTQNVINFTLEEQECLIYDKIIFDDETCIKLINWITGELNVRET